MNVKKEDLRLAYLTIQEKYLTKSAEESSQLLTNVKARKAGTSSMRLPDTREEHNVRLGEELLRKESNIG